MLTAVITSPQDGDLIAGPAAANVAFAATLSGAAPGPTLQLRWWSTVPPRPLVVANLPPNQVPPMDDIAIAPQSLYTSLKAPLWVGSQAITLAVKDQPGDAGADLKQVTQAASAGGTQPPHPCVVHVVVADPYLPPTTGGVVMLPRAFGLWAQAPANWKTTDYAALNLLTYSWTIAPSGGGAPVTLPHAVTDLSFRAPDTAQKVPPLVGLPTVPAEVPAGAATLTLTVSATRADRVSTQHQSQVPVMVQD